MKPFYYAEDEERKLLTVTLFHFYQVGMIGFLRGGSQICESQGGESVGHTGDVVGNGSLQAVLRYEPLKVTRHQFRIAAESFEKLLLFEKWHLTNQPQSGYYSFFRTITFPDDAIGSKCEQRV